jgi:CubicO group peptidase (beta-lactamase class C family)
VLTATTCPAKSAPDMAAVKEILTQTLRFWHAPGIAAVIVQDDKAHYSTDGMCALGDDRAVTADTLFPIGSCTKAFTATALGCLVDDGAADWDDLVRKHLPWFRLDDPLADRQVALRDLLCHRTGLGRHDLLWYRAPWSIEESVRRLAFLPRSTSFRSTYEYNNLAYLAAGLAITSAAKKPWHEFVRARLLEPLGMKNVVFTSGEAQTKPDHASPHGHDAKGNVVSIPWYKDDRQIRASGSIKANVRDLSRWVRFQLGGQPYEGDKPPVSAEALAETHTPQIPVPLSAAEREAGSTQASYGLGWHITDYRGHAIHEHGGAVEGFRARIILVPRRKLGIALLTNLDDMEIVNAAGNNLLDCLLGLEKKDWNAFFDAQSKKAQAARKERLSQKRGRPVPGTKPSRELQAYTGTYRDPAYGAATIRLEGESLVLSWSSYRLPLKPFHYETFIPEPKDKHLPAGLVEDPIVFELNADAEVAVMRFLGRPFQREKIRKK